METHPALPARAPWRTAVTLALVMALLVLGVILTVRFRHDHRDEWVDGTVAWRGFDLSDDGRSLTFHAWGTAPCIEGKEVTFSHDPTEGGEVVATLRTTHQSVYDGHVRFCYASLQIDSPWQTVTLDRPIPDGTIITDGVAADQLDPMFCDRPVTQVVRAPTVLGETQPCSLGG